MIKKNTLVLMLFIGSFSFFSVSVNAVGNSGITIEKIVEVQISKEISFGSTGNDVKILQRFLAEQPNIYPGGLVTGFFGPLTKQAVIRLQEKQELAPTGRVDLPTLHHVNSILSKGNAPVISAIRVKNIDTDSVEVRWETDVPSTSKIFYSISPLFVPTGKTFSAESQTLRRTHIMILNHLAPSVTYNYVVSSKTETGANSVSKHASFAL